MFWRFAYFKQPEALIISLFEAKALIFVFLQNSTLLFSVHCLIIGLILFILTTIYILNLIGITYNLTTLSFYASRFALWFGDLLVLSNPMLLFIIRFVLNIIDARFKTSHGRRA